MIERGESDAMRITSKREERLPLCTSTGAITVYLSAY